LIVKSGQYGAVWEFSNQSAARYGFTPVWFNRRTPSGADLFLDCPNTMTDGDAPSANSQADPSPTLRRGNFNSARSPQLAMNTDTLITMTRAIL
jgi:hypothetical protein